MKLHFLSISYGIATAESDLAEKCLCTTSSHYCFVSQQSCVTTKKKKKESSLTFFAHESNVLTFFFTWAGNLATNSNESHWIVCVQYTPEQIRKSRNKAELTSWFYLCSTYRMNTSLTYQYIYHKVFCGIFIDHRSPLSIARLIIQNLSAICFLKNERWFFLW